MKLKEKFQRFWTLSKSHKGFTLVELIVVIAILAILAGVAIPVYNGYIKKANTAADEQLLDTINTAFAAACLDNGFSQYDVAEATLPVATDGSVGALTAVKHANGKDVTSGIRSAYALFFEGNDGAKFNVYRSVVFANGMFVGAEAQFGGLYASFIESVKDTYAAQIGAIGDSAYANMGTDGMMSQLSEVSGIVADFSNGSAVGAVLQNEEFLKYTLAALGDDPTKYGDKNAMLGALVDKRSELAQQMSDASNGALSFDDAVASITGNAVLLYAAQNSATTNPSTALKDNNGNIVNADYITNNIRNGDASAGITQAALMCGLYTSYVNSDGYNGTNKEVNIETVMAAIGSDTVAGDAGFLAYVNDSLGSDTNTQGYKDLQGYLGAMQIISSTSGNAEITENLMVNGFGDQDLIDALNGLLG